MPLLSQMEKHCLKCCLNRSAQNGHINHHQTDGKDDGLCRVLLILVAVLGVVSGVAFSAAYQLVARFANKNTIALGLGCVGSGLVVLILESVLRIHATPTHSQDILLFELTAGSLCSAGPQTPHFQSSNVQLDRLEAADEGSTIHSELAKPPH